MQTPAVQTPNKIDESHTPATLKIQVASDLHFHPKSSNQQGIVEELDDTYLTRFSDDQAPDALLLAGDITNYRDKNKVISALREVVNKKTQILYVLGNHEYYGCDHANTTLEDYQNCVEPGMPGVYIADNSIRYIKNEAIVIMSTLWSDLREEDNARIAITGINDFKWPGLTINWYNKKFIEAKKFLTLTLKGIHLSGFKGKVIVMTHHAPDWSLVSPRWWGHSLNPCFCSDLSTLLNKEWSPDLWVYGHMHSSSYLTMGKTTLVRNPRGYGIENAGGYDPGLVITL
jgi:predicted MPP superfamily phosphohydrolase